VVSPTWGVSSKIADHSHKVFILNHHPINQYSFSALPETLFISKHRFAILLRPILLAVNNFYPIRNVCTIPSSTPKPSTQRHQDPKTKKPDLLSSANHIFIPKDLPCTAIDETGKLEVMMMIPLQSKVNRSDYTDYSLS
jgi:hypothetical protein